MTDSYQLSYSSIRRGLRLAAAVLVAMLPVIVASELGAQAEGTPEQPGGTLETRGGTTPPTPSIALSWVALETRGDIAVRGECQVVSGAHGATLVRFRITNPTDTPWTGQVRGAFARQRNRYWSRSHREALAVVRDVLIEAQGRITVTLPVPRLREADELTVTVLQPSESDDSEQDGGYGLTNCLHGRLQDDFHGPGIAYGFVTSSDVDSGERLKGVIPHEIPWTVVAQDILPRSHLMLRQMNLMVASDSAIAPDLVPVLRDAIRAGGRIMVLHDDRSQSNDQLALSNLMTMLLGKPWDAESWNSDVELLEHATATAAAGGGRATQRTFTAAGHELFVPEVRGHALPTDAVRYTVGNGVVTVVGTRALAAHTKRAEELFRQTIVPPETILPAANELPELPLNVMAETVIPAPVVLILLLIYIAVCGPLLAVWVRKRRPALLVPLTGACALAMVILVVIAKSLMSAIAPDRIEVVVSVHDHEGHGIRSLQAVGLTDEREEALPAFPADALVFGFRGENRGRGIIEVNDAQQRFVTTGMAPTHTGQYHIEVPARHKHAVRLSVSDGQVRNDGAVEITGGAIVFARTRTPATSRLAWVPPLKPGQSAPYVLFVDQAGKAPLSPEQLQVLAAVTGVGFHDIRDFLPTVLPRTQSEVQITGQLGYAAVFTAEPATEPQIRGESSEAVRRYAVSVVPIADESPAQPRAP